MSSFWSRILIAAVGLPAVLGLVWLGGWWLWALAVAAGLVALHEFYGMARALRPLVLAGYTGLVLVLLGAQLSGPTWMLAGFLATLALAFLLKGISETRQSLTVAVATTLAGVAWVGLGLGYVLLLRDIPEHGRLAVFTVLLAVFAADTLAFAAHDEGPEGRQLYGLAGGQTVADFAQDPLDPIAADARRKPGC